MATRRKDEGPKLICDRCGEELGPDNELIACPTCGDKVCTQNCIAGVGVQCFHCEDAAWGDHEEGS